ncbi:MAG TPA: hypothetical protein VGF36_00665 [Rhodopila sp.]
MSPITAALIRVMLRVLHHNGMVLLVLGNHRMMLHLDVRLRRGPVVAHRRRLPCVMLVTLRNAVLVTLWSMIRLVGSLIMLGGIMVAV